MNLPFGFSKLKIINIRINSNADKYEYHEPEIHAFTIYLINGSLKIIKMKFVKYECY